MRPYLAPDSRRDGAQALTGAHTAAVSAFSEAMRQHRPGHAATPDLVALAVAVTTTRP
jgi:hypothetical protein